MPPRSKLSDQAIADLTTWVEIGAPWPDNTVGNTTGHAGGLATTIRTTAKSLTGHLEKSRNSRPRQSRITHGPKLPLIVLSIAFEATLLSPSPPTDRRN